MIISTIAARTRGGPNAGQLLCSVQCSVSIANLFQPFAALPKIKHQFEQNSLRLLDFLRALRSVQARIGLRQQIDSVPYKKHWIFREGHRASPNGLKIPNYTFV
jgi:hypothetical protein